MQRYTLLKIVIAGLNQKFLYWLMTKKVVKNERLVCLVQANDVKEALITMGIMQKHNG
jgi:hypothetical protein